MTDIADDIFSWAELYDEIRQRLNSDHEARLIIQELSQQPGSNWLSISDSPAPPHIADDAGSMVKRRLDGEPLQYVLGAWGFRNLTLRVDQRVLIPRPETEQLVEGALKLLASEHRPLVADLGTGSGAIALSIVNEHPTALVFATDESAAALEVARLNSTSLDPAESSRVRFEQGNWFEALPDSMRGQFDLIVSNPPYIGEHEAGTVEDQVADYEPHSALFSGPDGLDDLREILTGAAAWLKPRGSVAVELAPHQAEVMVKFARALGYEPVAVGKDLAGRERFLVAASPGA